MPRTCVAMNMLVYAIFVLGVIDYLWSGTQPVDASQFYETETNNVGGKIKRDAGGKGCKLPSSQKNGLYTPSSRRCRPQDTTSACRMIAGTQVPEHWPIFSECDPGYVHSTTDEGGAAGRRAVICRNGNWSPELPTCVESRYSSKNLPHFQSSSDICGRPAKHLIRKREVYGTVSRKGAWPWMVIFGMRKNNTQRGDIHWFCAGTLVTTRHILTSAHCIADYRRRNTFFARFNDINLDDTSDNKGVIEVEIQRNNIIIHPSFRKEKVFSHNIAIVKLNDDLPITDSVRPVCLPTPDFATRSFDGDIGYFISWGQTDNDREWSRKRRYQPILHELKATVVNHVDCNYNYRNYQSDDFVIIGWDLICASVPINKSCQGDAGSPLMLKIKDRYVLYGIVATPFRCYDELFPRLFTNLPIFMDWIIANLKI